MKYLPICIDIKDESCLVVGGGSTAVRKAKRLLSAGAEVTVVSPVCSSEIEQMATRQALKLSKTSYSSQNLAGINLVIAATDDPAINERVSIDAKSRGLLVNVVDSPGLCNFIVPSIVDRSPLTIAISSSGSAPVFARMLREKLEWLVPREIGPVLQKAGQARKQVADNFTEMSERRQFWENYFEHLLDWSPAKNIADSTRVTIDASVQLSPEEFAKNSSQISAVISLIDLGCGDVDYLPIKTIKRLQKTDEVIYNSSLPGAITDLIRRDAEMHPVNLAPGENILAATMVQNLSDKRSAGKSICILNGGHDFEAAGIKKLAATFTQTDAKLELIKALRA